MGKMIDLYNLKGTVVDKKVKLKKALFKSMVTSKFSAMREANYLKRKQEQFEENLSDADKIITLMNELRSKDSETFNYFNKKKEEGLRNLLYNPNTNLYNNEKITLNIDPFITINSRYSNILNKNNNINSKFSYTNYSSFSEAYKPNNLKGIVGKSVIKQKPLNYSNLDDSNIST